MTICPSTKAGQNEETVKQFIKGTDYNYYVLDDGTIQIAAYKRDASKLIIPSQIDNKPVTGIGDSAFEYCDSLTSVTIPDSVTGIGD